jgi:hypothetical protein
MTYWVFTSEAAAAVAQQACMDALPVDTIDGVEAPVQITEAWADVLPTTDGRFGFVACPLVEQPGHAMAVTDEEWAAMRPAPAVVDPMAV